MAYRKSFKRKGSFKSKKTFYKTARRVHPKNDAPRGGYRL